MPATGDTISVLCACGKKLKAPASAVGRRAKCPSCANVLTIELPPPPPDIPEVAEDDPLGAMYDLAETEKAAAHSNQLDDSPRCPKCAASMQAGAVLCTNCGFDTRSNKKVGAAPIAKPVIDYDKPAKKKKRDKMAPDGSFLIGLLASFGGALLGGFVWFLVTWGTGYDFYIVCMLIGIGAGLGMQIGQKGFSTLGGYAAAGMTLVVLMLARLAVIIALLLPMIRRGAIHMPSSHSGSAQAQTANGQNSADESDDDETATANNSNPSANTPAARSSASSSTASAHSMNASVAIGGLVILLLFFGWKGILFTILTLFMAYRTASGSVSG